MVRAASLVLGPFISISGCVVDVPGTVPADGSLGGRQDGLSGPDVQRPVDGQMRGPDATVADALNMSDSRGATDALKDARPRGDAHDSGPQTCTKADCAEAACMHADVCVPEPPDAKKPIDGGIDAAGWSPADISGLLL